MDVCLHMWDNFTFSKSPTWMGKKIGAQNPKKRVQEEQKGYYIDRCPGWDIAHPFHIGTSNLEEICQQCVKIFIEKYLNVCKEIFQDLV